MKNAFGPLQWAPETFWKSTLTEYMAAIQGYNMANSPKETEAPSDDAIDALVKKYGG